MSDFSYLQHLQAHQLEAPLLKPLDDLPHETTVDSIRLHSDEGLLPHIWWGTWWHRAEINSHTSNPHIVPMSDIYREEGKY